MSSNYKYCVAYKLPWLDQIDVYGLFDSAAEAKAFIAAYGFKQPQYAQVVTLQTTAVQRHAAAQTPPLDPREADYTREGIFIYHNCAQCGSGQRPCKRGNASQCEYPRARDD
jgi:hypothetical protein